MGTLSSLMQQIANDTREHTLTSNTYAYLRHMYAIQLMQQANVANVDTSLTMQYGIRHNASWVHSTELVDAYKNLNHDSLMGWNAHHYSKLIKRSLHYLKHFENMDYFIPLDMAPNMYHSIENTLMELIRALENGVTLLDIANSDLGTELEVTESALHGYRTTRTVGKTRFNPNRACRKIDPNNVPANPEIHSKLMSLVSVLALDHHPEVNKCNFVHINTQIHFVARILNIVTMLQEYVGLTDWYGAPEDFNSVDKMYDYCVRHRQDDLTSVVLRVRHYASIYQTTPESTIIMLDTPVLINHNDQNRVPTYGDTMHERYLVCDFMERKYYTTRDRGVEEGVDAVEG